MIKGARAHKKDLVNRLTDPHMQREYLKASIEENTDMPEAILSAIRDIAEVRGYENLAREAGLSQKALYKILDSEKESKPRFETVVQLLQALGLRFTVKPLHRHKVS